MEQVLHNIKYSIAVIDIESTGLDKYEDKITYVGIGLVKSLKSLDVDKYLIYNMNKKDSVEALKHTLDKLEKYRMKLVFQNGKFDTMFLTEKGFKYLPIGDDIMLMGTAYDLSATHSLKDMAQRHLKVDNWDIDKKTKKSFDNPETEKYLKFDLKYTYMLYRFFKKNMTKKQKFIYKNLLKPAYLLYRKVEMKGIYINKKGLEKVKLDYAKKEKDKLKELKKLADINWNSSTQVSKKLFNEWGLPTVKVSSKTGNASADAAVLRRLSSQGYEIADKLLDYKFYYGANSKFLKRWGNFAKYDGRIHPSFNITNVRTGRTSCSNPNLQQVPRNPELRTLFTAPKGRKFIEADYSQVELRIAAMYAKEPTMTHIYKIGGDIHLETAASVMGKPKTKVTKEDRSKAKAVNFGFLYGMQAKKFASYSFDSYGVSVNDAEAEKYRQLFFNKYSRLLVWHKEMEQLCDYMGGVENMFGRFMALPDIYDQNRWVRGSAIRKAINSPVQSTASDLLLLAAVEVDKELSNELDLSVVGTVHDSILIEVAEEYIDDACEEIKRIMVNPKSLELFDVEFTIPMEVDVGVGSWGAK